MIEIPRQPDGQPGTYRPLILNGKQTAKVFCPECGRGANLDAHVIHDDGRVEPSLVCPSLDCKFHGTHVRLLNWIYRHNGEQQ